MLYILLLLLPLHPKVSSMGGDQVKKLSREMNELSGTVEKLNDMDLCLKVLLISYNII